MSGSEILAVGCLASAVGLVVVASWPALKPKLKQVPVIGRWMDQRPAAAASLPQSIEPAIDVRGSRPGFLRVLDAQTLLQVCNGGALIENMYRQSRLARAVFDRDLLTALEAYSRFVQLMPASESHHHAHIGGLLAHTLEVVNAAMTLRNAYLLPRGGSAETIDLQRDHWTYAIFFAALFHDIGKPMTDLRINMRTRSRSDEARWMSIAGSLADCDAIEYAVDFAPKSERDYGAHRRFPVALMQRQASAHALAFVAQEPALMTELAQFLSGEPSGTGAMSVIAEIVRRADQESTRSNLAQGPRNRFATAVSVPLIDRLMQSLRAMLSAGGALPLNRDGAAGWVFDGAIWFVAKRLADTVREHIAKTAPDDDSVGGVPGANKNDRFFDTWQEYGMVTLNPETGQSIWYVAVDGAGYSHDFTVLRFPLEKLYESESLYPAPMLGAIRIVARKTKRADDAVPFVQSPPIAASTSQDPVAPPSPSVSASVASEPVSAPSPSTESASIPPLVKRAPSVRKPNAESSGASCGDADAVELALRHADPDDVFMDDEDSASIEAREMHKQKHVAPPSSGVVTPYVAPLPALLGQIEPVRQAGEPSEPAIRFMNWLQSGISDGSLKYNESGAVIHFVAQGMVLVSPKIFRDFAMLYGETGDGTASDREPKKVGSGIQRHVTTAGWNAIGRGNSNIFEFSVVKRGGERVSKLSGVVILRPERWITPVPPANPSIVLVQETQ